MLLEDLLLEFLGIESDSIVLEIKAKPEYMAELRSAISQYVADAYEKTVVERTHSISTESISTESVSTEFVSTEFVSSVCSTLDDLRSIESKNKTSIRFVNNHENQVHVYWIDFKRKEVLYKSLAKGESYIQGTYLTHQWLVRDDNGSCLDTFEPVENVSEAVVF